MIPLFFTLNRPPDLLPFEPTAIPNSVSFPSSGGISTHALSAEVEQIRIDSCPKWMMVRNASNNTSLETGDWYTLKAFKISTPINVLTLERSGTVMLSCRTADNREGVAWVNVTQASDGGMIDPIQPEL